MRAVIVALLLAGCFNPTTNQKCQYQCATTGTACPSGLSCVAGMCVAPGETCGPGDGGVDTGDGHPAACGDGIHDPGEICYGQPIQIIATDVVYDAQLADMDGDGDLDLAYLIADQYIYYTLDGGMFSGPRIGPTVFASHMIATNVDTDPEAELINAADAAELWDSSAGAYIRTGNATFVPPNVAIDLAMGIVAASSGPNVIALQTNELSVYTIDAASALTYFTGQSSITGAEAVAAGRLDSDTLDDIVIARMTGVTLHRSTGSGLAPEIALPVAGTVQGVAVGDVDHDTKNDVVFAQQSGANSDGVLGVMRGNGAASFSSATMTARIASLQKSIETAKVDGDALADVVGLKFATSAVVIALGKSDGTLAAPVEIPIAVPATYVHANADFNGDGAPDIVVTDPNTQTILVLPSNP